MKTEPIHRTSMWKFKLSAATMTLIPAAVGINYVAKPWRRGKVARLAGVFGDLSCQHVGWAGCRCHQWFHQQRDLWAYLIANFNRVCDYQHRNWDCCRSFARQWVVLVSATSICFCYYYCLRFSCHFNATQRHLLGWSDRYRLGVTHCLR